MKADPGDILMLAMLTVAGVGLLIVARTQAMTLIDRIETASVGAIVLLGVSVSVLLLKFLAR